MTKKEACELLDKYLDGTATPGERALFEQLSNRVTRKRLEHSNAESYKDIGEDIFMGLPEPRPFFKRNRFLAVAASFILFISAAAIIYYSGYHNVNDQPETTQTADIEPGRNQATLTLANGKKIMLTDAGNGELARQSGISIRKNRNGELVYTVVMQKTHNPVEYNTTETPKGGQFRVDLADGTKVWLNSSSSLRYPTRFTGKDRQVVLTGEAYFEVAHQASKPFKVLAGKQLVTVLGTHFNICAYHDEPSMRTTLLEGKVKVSTVNGLDSKILKPGEQAALVRNQIEVTEGDPEQAVAWKNGYFRFKGENIESIMRKLSRWYNIDVKYGTAVSNEGYYGTVSRSKNIRQVLAVLSETGLVHFKIEGRSVTVME